MKNILITGKTSYVGNSVEAWLKQYGDEYQITKISLKTDDWKAMDFANFDCIFHVAGIAHRKNAPDELYEEVNHLLAVEVARKAVNEGVGQLILMSSGAVYSQNDKKHKYIEVDENTSCNPSTAYGISKLKADKDIQEIAKTSKTKVVTLRPPMIYGFGAKGNYNSLRKISLKSPAFPKIENNRSMIYIDNLCEFIKLVIDNNVDGVFLPQNKEYVSTYKMVQLIAESHSKKIICTSIALSN